MERNKKKGRIPKSAFYLLILLVIGSVFLYSSHPFILLEAGKFLAPDEEGRALQENRRYDAAILESGELVREDELEIGVKIISSKKADRLVVVYQKNEKQRILGRPANFEDFLIREMEGLGLRRDQIKIIAVPEKHPVTLTEARIVLADLSKAGIRSAILLTEDFHSRRSYWAYKQVGAPLGIEIISYPYFGKFQRESWWKEATGVRNFSEELVKFFYYVGRGYIPLKSLLVT